MRSTTQPVEYARLSESPFWSALDALRAPALVIFPFPYQPVDQLTMAINFTASGTRWRAVPVSREDIETEHVPKLPGTGVLFTSAEGDMRFLSLDGESVPTVDDLRAKPMSELATLVERAAPIAR